MQPDNKPKTRRGFAAMSPEKRREIAAKGGRTSKGGGRPYKNRSLGREKAVEQ